MSTISQLLKYRISRKKKIGNIARALNKCPQKLGLCMKIITMSPKKPNSAVRKVAKVRILSLKKSILAYIAGQGHKLQQYATVLVRGGRVKDLPGVGYHLIRGKKDFKRVESFQRVNARSKYSIKNSKI